MRIRNFLFVALFVWAAFTCWRSPLEAKEARTLKGHTGRVTAVAFSPDGRTLASASADKTVKLWDVTTGELRMTLSGHTGVVSCVAFSSDGNTLASGSHDTQVKLWDVATGNERATLSGHHLKVKCLAFSPDGKRLASGSEDTTLRLWNATTGEPVGTLEGHSRAVLCLAFAPDGDRLASGSADQTVKLWSAAGRCEQTPGPLRRRGKRGPIVSVAFSPNGIELAMATSDFVAIWELSHAERRFALTGRRNASIWAVRYSPHGGLLATASGANDSHATRLESKKGSASGSRQLKENEIKLWDAATGLERGSLNGHCGPVRALDFSPDGGLLASASGDKTVMVWDVARYHEWKVDPTLPELSASTAGTSLRCPSRHCVSADESANEDSGSSSDDDEWLLIAGGAISLSAKPGPPRSPSSRHVRSVTGYEDHSSKSTLFEYHSGGGHTAEHAGGSGKVEAEKDEKERRK